MIKTLWCENERKSNLEIPKYHKVTATKIDEIEARVENLYQDDEGNKYIVKYNKFMKRYEFTQI